ncbi:hypothetical protein Hanom_Chr11g01001601 [Helianthus anomalus]
MAVLEKGCYVKDTSTLKLTWSHVMKVDVEHVMKEARMKNLEQMVGKYEGEKKDVTFEICVRLSDMRWC